MTPDQRKHFYFPAWHRCSKANAWQMVDGRLLAVLDEQLTLFATWPDPAGPLACEIVRQAINLAHHEHRAPTAEDLRHACNAAATAGRTTSSGKLTNKEINRCVNLFDLLTDPWNLHNVTTWLHPEDGEKRLYLAYLRRQASEAILTQISLNAFDTRRYQELDIQKLRWIAKQVKDRQAA